MSIQLTNAEQEMLKDLLVQYLKESELWIFGSRSNGTAKTYSDVDLVLFTQTDQSRTVNELREAIAESNFPYLVDLHVWEEIPDFQKNICETAEIFLSKDPNRVGKSAKEMGIPSSSTINR